MNTHALTSIVIALGISTCTATLAADEGTPRTRAEVIAERDATLASGWLTAMTGEDSGSFYLSQQPWGSSRTRAEVVAEVRAARESGLLAEIQRENSEAPALMGESNGIGAARHVVTDIESDVSPPATLSAANHGC